MTSSSLTDCREREEHNRQQHSKEQLLSSRSHDTSVITSHEKAPPVIRRDGGTVSVLSGSCYLSKKKTLLPNLKEIKEDISIVKLNLSNFHKAVITWLKSTETLKNRSCVTATAHACI